MAAVAAHEADDVMPVKILKAPKTKQLKPIKIEKSSIVKTSGKTPGSKNPPDDPKPSGSPGIPLVCLVCTNTPRFSDLSHLLTHLSSKGHLQTHNDVRIRATQDLAAAEKVTTYDKWYKDYGIERMLAERLKAKDEKARGISRPGQGTSQVGTLSSKDFSCADCDRLSRERRLVRPLSSVRLMTPCSRLLPPVDFLASSRPSHTTVTTMIWPRPRLPPMMPLSGVPTTWSLLDSRELFGRAWVSLMPPPLTRRSSATSARTPLCFERWSFRLRRSPPWRLWPIWTWSSRELVMSMIHLPSREVRLVKAYATRQRSNWLITLTAQTGCQEV